MTPAEGIRSGLDAPGISRARFREFYQPSRIVIAMMPSPNHASGYNPITLCFTMWTSYKPRMMALAIQDSNFSHSLAMEVRELSLSVPGTSLLDETIFFGVESGRKHDKIEETGLSLTAGRTIEAPSFSKALASMELKIRNVVVTGDHALLVGEVTHMVGRNDRESPLLSVGAKTRGFTVLRKHGQHRLAIAATPDSSWLL